MKPQRILFVCMGNICRSPSAEGVMRHLVCQAKLDDWIKVDSAGTHGYHVGSAPDPRAVAAAHRRGYDISNLRAREICAEDFEEFDLLLGMDFNNLELLQVRCPPQHEAKLGLLMPYALKRRALIIHDPYYRSAGEFEQVLDYIEDACEGLLRALASPLKEGGEEGARFILPHGRMLDAVSATARNMAGSSFR
jgi:protein-tyrosine phosphatase